MKQKITQVVFSKEDLLAKKQITNFLLEQQVEFVPDEHKFGSYHAFIKINHLCDAKQKQFASHHNSPLRKNKSQTNVPQAQIEQLQNLDRRLKFQQNYFKQPQSPRKKSQSPPQKVILKNEEDQVTKMLYLLEVQMRKQADALNHKKPNQKQQIQSEAKIQSISDIKSIYLYLKTVYKDFKGSQTFKMGVSLFMVVLYYYYCGRQKQFEHDLNQLFAQFRQIELPQVVKLFDSVFLQDNASTNVTNQTFMRGVKAIKEGNYSSTETNIFNLCVLFMNTSKFRADLDKLIDNPKSDYQMTFGQESNVDRSQNIKQSSKSPTRQQTTQLKQKEKQFKTLNNSFQKQKTPQGSPKNRVITENTQINREYSTVKKKKQISPPHLTEKKKDYNLKKDHNLKKDYHLKKEENKYQQKNVSPSPTNFIHTQDTFRAQDHGDKSQSVEKSNKDLNRVFNQIMSEQFDKNHSSWFKQLQVLPQYQQSPKVFEYKYQSILSKLLQDRVELMSSDELMSYYERIVRKARSLYLVFLRERGVKLRLNQV